MQSSDAFAPKYSELVYSGFWFSPERATIQALITETQRGVIRVVSLSSTRATYHHRRPQNEQRGKRRRNKQGENSDTPTVALETAIDGTDTAARATKSFGG